jgi:hypothetical protein
MSELVNTIKRVYASTFYQSAKDYIKVTAYRLEEEKMAVIIQKMVGVQHDGRFYPDFSGVAKSYNFYPLTPQKSEDGIVSAALGLGKMVVDGGITVKFCPKYPNHLLQFFSGKEALRNNQNEFYALEMYGQPLDYLETHDILLKRFGLDVAEGDGSLTYVGSTYSPQNDALTDGLSRQGIRVVTFAPILRNKMFPLPQILELLLDMGEWGMGTPVEIEFAVNMSPPPGKPKEFGLLQMRPLVLSREVEELNIEDVPIEQLLCQSHQVLGNGAIRDVHDIVAVDIQRFERSRTHEVAMEITQFNEELIAQRRPYLLIGLGRWGTLDPWLGIPVKWDQISGARAIIEAGFKDLDVAPSQGSHFFQNITSFQVGYFTVHSKIKAGFIDWDWLSKQRAVEEKQFTRHLRFETPITIKMNGHQNKGIILKPEGHLA